ncbi:hypothetical protein NHP164001_10460 [Helicobacter trogontum]|uniref:N-acetyltransferase domain-containing protein n=2 Tax=Helicobacter trogontum TaxID=50960 RepID=A0ABQ0D3W1_9HELI
MTMECRELKIAYLEECSSLYVDVFKREPWNEDNSLEDVRGYFLVLLQMNTFLGFVLMCGDHVVGICVGYIKPYIFNCSVYMEYEIEQFFIASDYQNRGYGGWFLENIIQQLQSCKK